MSEGGSRICENCGTEISQTTNFCPNCGAAQRPDPDVPTGPPPHTPEAGSISTPSASDIPQPPKQPQQRPLRSILTVIAVLVVGVMLIRACGGESSSTQGGSGSKAESTNSSASQSSSSSSDSSSNKKQSKETTVGIGQPANVGDSSWTVTSANRVNQLNSKYSSDRPKQGDFVIVDFTFTNNGKEAKTLSHPIINLIDSSSRKSSLDNDTFGYIPNEKDIFLNQVNPGISKQGEGIFSVAPGSSGFKLELGDTSYFNTDKVYVDLGF